MAHAEAMSMYMPCLTDHLPELDIEVAEVRMVVKEMRVFDSSSSKVPDLEDSPVPTTLCNITGLLEVESLILNVSSNSNDTFDQLLDDLGEGQ